MVIVKSVIASQYFKSGKMDKFILFGERPFNRYTHERFSLIEQNINSLSDIEVLMYKDNFGSLVKKLVNSYSLFPVNILFEDKIVDLVDRYINNRMNYFAEYTLMLTGDSALLRLDPYNSGHVDYPIPVVVKTNVISFEIGINYYKDDLSLPVIKDIEREYDSIKKFIGETLLSLNNESQKFNLQLEEFIVPILAKKMRDAYNLTVIKQKLNFN